MRDDAMDLSLYRVNMCKVNLLKFYCVEYMSLPVVWWCGHLEKYTWVVFQLSFETVIIKSLFGIMNYNKDKKRARLNNKSVASVIQTRDIVKVTKKVAAPFAPADLTICIQHALDHSLEW